MNIPAPAIFSASLILLLAMAQPAYSNNKAGEIDIIDAITIAKDIARDEQRKAWEERNDKCRNAIAEKPVQTDKTGMSRQIQVKRKEACQRLLKEKYDEALNKRVVFAKRYTKTTNYLFDESDISSHTRKKLEGKVYWLIYFRPISHYPYLVLDGGYSVFIDANTSEILYICDAFCQ